ncbi:MAG: alpha/beta hydrolase [Aestuariivita sp.]|nr:alpha/beta hydrolase [Aestuariivita sp.]
MIALVCLLLLSIVIVIPFWRENKLKTMNDMARKKAPGQFVKLTNGMTHYEWFGPSDAPVIVCIHGLTTPAFVWNGLIQDLIKLGYRVLIYDLYGRGFSDRPKDLQNRTFFLRQLNELLESQDVNKDITVFGFSLGGAIATAFASARSCDVQQLILIAPAGIKIEGMQFIRRIMLTLGLGDWFARSIYRWLHRRNTETERSFSSSVPNIVDRQQQELDYKGFCPAVLSSLRGIARETQDTDHKLISQFQIPTLVILGETDEIIPPSVRQQLNEWNANTHIALIQNAGHGIPYTHSPQISEILKDFLQPQNTAVK